MHSMAWNDQSSTGWNWTTESVGRQSAAKCRYFLADILRELPERICAGLGAPYLEVVSIVRVTVGRNQL